MHRTYRPYSPVTCVYLKEKWDKGIFRFHRQKVHAAKAVIDNCHPKIYQHVIAKLKKLQYESTRAEIVERDNKMLLFKMKQIMRSGGRTDHRNDYLIYYKSLNAAKLKRELVRVAKENRAILKRLIAREPNYSYQKLIKDWQENQQFLKNISKYPPPIRGSPSQWSSSRSSKSLKSYAK